MENKYDWKVDLWSLGTILYELLVGKSPFIANSFKELIDKINEGRYVIPASLKLSSECKNMIGGLLTIDPDKRFSWNDFFDHRFISDESEESENQESEELTNTAFTNIKIKSDEIVNQLLKDEQSIFTQKVGNSEINQDPQSDPKESERNQDKAEDDEEFLLKSNSTELKFYDSTASKGEPDRDSFVDSSHKHNRVRQSLEVVKEASHKTNEEDNEEELKYIDANILDKNAYFRNQSDKLNEFEINIEEEIKQELKQDIDKIFEFMVDLLHRSKMILSFYKEQKTLELCPNELEIAYLLNKIWYESKTFISTFYSSKEGKEDASLQIVSDSKENIKITEELISTLKRNAEYNKMIRLIVNYFLLMSKQVLNTYSLINKIDESFQKTLASSLTKFCIEIIEEAVVLDEEELKEEAIQKYSQAQFILDELLCEYYKAPQFDNIEGVANTDSNNGSQWDKSDVMKSSRNHKWMNSIQSQNGFVLTLQDVNEDEIDKIYDVITSRIKLLSQSS